MLGGQRTAADRTLDRMTRRERRPGRQNHLLEPSPALGGPGGVLRLVGDGRSGSHRATIAEQPLPAATGRASPPAAPAVGGRRVVGPSLSLTCS